MTWSNLMFHNLIFYNFEFELLKKNKTNNKSFNNSEDIYCVSSFKAKKYVPVKVEVKLFKIFK